MTHEEFIAFIEERLSTAEIDRRVQAILIDEADVEDVSQEAAEKLFLAPSGKVLAYYKTVVDNCAKDYMRKARRHWRLFDRLLTDDLAYVQEAIHTGELPPDAPEDAKLPIVGFQVEDGHYGFLHAHAMDWTGKKGPGGRPRKKLATSRVSRERYMDLFFLRLLRIVNRNKPGPGDLFEALLEQHGPEVMETLSRSCVNYVARQIAIEEIAERFEAAFQKREAELGHELTKDERDEVLAELDGGENLLADMDQK